MSPSEPLVDVQASAPLRVAGPTRRTLLRFGVVERLVLAQSLLPRDLHLVVVDGHRPGDDHGSGGAADLTVFRADDDVPAALPCCRCDPAPPLEERVRLLLTEALSAAGLVNDVARWWHWSYGDSSWAAATGAANARYEAVARL